MPTICYNVNQAPIYGNLVLGNLCPIVTKDGSHE